MKSLIKISTYSDFQDGCLFLPGIAQQITAEISRNLISQMRSCHFSEIMMSLQGNSLPKLGKPTEIAIFGQFHLVMCMPITKLNVMIPVLLKTSFKYRFHPLGPPLPHPLGPPPCATPLVPTPLPLSATPSPDNLDPCQK